MSLTRLAIRILLPIVLLTTCTGDTMVSPGGSVRSQMDVTGLFRAGDQFGIPIDQVDLTLTRVSDNTVAFSRTLTAAEWAASGGNLTIALTLDLDTSPEDFSFLAIVYSGGVEYYRASGTITALANQSVQTTPLTPTYTGPGANATAINFTLNATVGNGVTIPLIGDRPGRHDTGDRCAGRIPVEQFHPAQPGLDGTQHGDADHAGRRQRQCHHHGQDADRPQRDRDRKLGAAGGHLHRPDLGGCPDHRPVNRLAAAGGRGAGRGRGAVHHRLPGHVRRHRRSGRRIRAAHCGNDRRSRDGPRHWSTRRPQRVRCRCRPRPPAWAVRLCLFSTTIAGGALPPSAVVANSPVTQNATVGTAVGSPPSVKVTDANSAPVPNVSVTFAVASGGGSLTGPATVQTNASGIATVGGWVLGATAGATR